MNLFLRKFYNFSKIGFVGLGNMGLPMASNMVKKGYQVYAHDINISIQNQAENHQIKFSSNLNTLMKETDIFIAMLPNSQHSQQMCRSQKGIFKNAKLNSLIIDCSTISPFVAVQLAEQAKKNNLEYVDAPVSGGVTAATAGTLTFMVGANNVRIFQKCKGILQSMGKNIFNCEKVGSGQTAKICNNMALATQMIGISESLSLGKKLGMDPILLSNIMKVSTSRCWSIDAYNPVPGFIDNVPASRDYQKGFGCKLMLKDLMIAINSAKEVNAKTQLGEKSRNIYEQLTKQQCADLDFGVIYKILDQKK